VTHLQAGSYFFQNSSQISTFFKKIKKNRELKKARFYKVILGDEGIEPFNK
jgi:hypothetical protein